MNAWPRCVRARGAALSFTNQKACCSGGQGARRETALEVLFVSATTRPLSVLLRNGGGVGSSAALFFIDVVVDCVDFKEVVQHDHQHGGAAEEEGERVELRVGDHFGCVDGGLVSLSEGPGGMGCGCGCGWRASCEARGARELRKRGMSVGSCGR